MPGAPHRGAAEAGGERKPLGVIINELSACLDTGGEGASTQQPSDSTVLAARMRAVLPLVFAHVEPQQGAPQLVL